MAMRKLTKSEKKIFLRKLRSSDEKNHFIKVLQKSWEIINSAIPEPHLQEDAEKNLEDLREIIHFLEEDCKSPSQEKRK